MNTKNVAASVYAKLKAVAREQKLDMIAVLRRYAQERLLYRLSVSDVASDFCVKGGLLMTAYNDGNLLRPTEDIDFNGFRRDSTVETLYEALSSVLAARVDDDGVEFDIGTMKIERDRTGIVTGGKISIQSRIFSARIEVRIDVSYGNAITPDARMLEMPTLLEGVAPRPRVYAYPMATIIAEKTHALVQWGMLNSRVKDHFDLIFLSRLHSFQSDEIVAAIQNTFIAQDRLVPEAPLLGLTRRFAEDNLVPWKAFMRKVDLKTEMPFVDVVEELASFLHPLTEAARLDMRPGLVWTPREGWATAPEAIHGAIPR
jgi:predicted nucleotidyltransferase component of viral defense system